MSNYRKRKSSDSLESDRKRFSYERYDCDSYIKQENKPHGRLNHPSAPSNIQYVKSYQSRRYYNQYVEPHNSVKRNVINYNPSYDALAMYDDQRQMNFKYEVYLNSLRQCKSR